MIKCVSKVYQFPDYTYQQVQVEWYNMTTLYSSTFVKVILETKEELSNKNRLIRARGTIPMSRL